MIETTEDTQKILTRAVAQMRRLAQASQEISDEGNRIWYQVEGDDSSGWVTFAESHVIDAEFISSWPPPVALAVADWLEHTARYADSTNAIPALRGQGLEQAMTVSRTFLDSWNAQGLASA